MNKMDLKLSSGSSSRIVFAIFLSSGKKNTVFSWSCNDLGNEKFFELLLLPTFDLNHLYKSGLQNNRIGKNCLPSAKYDDENKGAPNFYFLKNIQICALFIAQPIIIRNRNVIRNGNAPPDDKIILQKKSGHTPNFFKN